ncbi:class I SAM-dependent methyltransferase [Niveispirillum sp. KHB5.9]|uniref:class I SAM-dependent methyltransferase n=1 Tax=Niveispirillum sp. KHB5.9 TaxID=3400269 RepID=UPI003A85151C
MSDELPVVLHVGCGVADPAKLPDQFFTPGQWRELRYDIDPDVAPDIIGTITDMTNIPTASVDAIWSSHNVEHLYPHEVPLALAEFRRVLKPGAFALITLPDLQSVAELVAAGKLEEPAYYSSAGPIAPIDILYGWRLPIANGNHYMAHKTGFVQSSLQRAMEEAGFVGTQVIRDGSFALWAKGFAPLP